MVPADLTFAAGNTEQWPFVQRGSGCFAGVATLQNLIQGSFSNSLDDTEKQYGFIYLHMKIILDYSVYKSSSHTKCRMQLELDLKATKSIKQEEKKLWGFYGQKAN